MIGRLRLVACALSVVGGVAPAAAQMPRVSIGTITSEQSCTTYRMSAGRSSMALNRYGLTASSSWRTWLERDCLDNWSTIRSSIAAALAATGKLKLTTRGAAGAYVVSVRVSELGSQTADISGGDFATRSDRVAVSMNILIVDPAGRIAGGGLVTRTLETGSTIQTDDVTTAASQDGRTIYTQLEHALALQTARMVSFRLAPMRVIGEGPDGIQLNYGAPLLALGTDLQVQTPDGRFSRYHVVAAGEGASIAEPDSRGTAVPVGSLATVIERDDPAANARTMRKVDLP